MFLIHLTISDPLKIHGFREDTLGSVFFKVDHAISEKVNGFFFNTFVIKITFVSPAFTNAVGR